MLEFDFLKGDWKVPLTPWTLESRAFVTPNHFLLSTVMPLGLRNAPSYFPAMMKTVVGDVAHCDVYPDDIVVYSSTWPEHIQSLRDIFSHLKSSPLTLNLAKCVFGKAIVSHLVKKKLARDKSVPWKLQIQAILESRCKLHRFLGTVGSYSAFCQGFLTWWPH